MNYILKATNLWKFQSFLKTTTKKNLQKPRIIKVRIKGNFRKRRERTKETEKEKGKRRIIEKLEVPQWGGENKKINYYERSFF
jgi:hypothetical protein